MTDAQDPKDANAPKKGGFGAFADKYRDRWAAEHPKATPRERAGTTPPDASESADAAHGTDESPPDTPPQP